MSYTCPACGYPDLAEPPSASGDSRTCPSCAFEFGVPGADDEVQQFFWRTGWIADGMPWRGNPAGPLPGWAPEPVLDAMLRERYPTPAGPFTCPVCGYPALTEEPRSSSGGGSYEICPSCGFEFGVTDDDLRFTYEDWRVAWVAMGMPWRDSDRDPPPGWEPERQLAAITGTA